MSNDPFVTIADCANATMIRCAARDLYRKGQIADALDLLKSHSVRPDIGPHARQSAADLYAELSRKDGE